MPFLVRSQDRFMLIENRNRQGLVYHPYTKDGFSKPIPIHSFNTENYTATLDAHSNLHVVTETNKRQMLYVRFDKGMPQKQVILEDPNHYYMFKHFHLHLLEGTLYLLYSVKHPTGTGRSLMYQPLDGMQSDVAVLLQSIPDNTIIKVIQTNNQLYILYTDFEEQHLLKLATLTTTGIEHLTVYMSTLPIIDFNACLFNGVLHITFIRDAYGKQQVGYTNTYHFNDYELPIPAQSSAPCIFTSSGNLWITYMHQHHLYMLLSSDEGHCFSIAVPSSLSGLFVSYDYRGMSSIDLNATMVHATVSSTLRLGVLGALDLKGIHPDMLPLAELDLLLEAHKLPPHPPRQRLTPPHPTSQKTPQPVQSTPPQVAPIPDQAIASFNQPLSPPPPPPPPPAMPLVPDVLDTHPTFEPPSDIQLATQAFMDGHTLFDARPK